MAAAARANRAACARGPPRPRAGSTSCAAVHSQARPLPLLRLPREEYLVREPLLRDLAIQVGAHEQFVMRALGRDPALLEHDDLVGERDRREAVADDERGALAHQ